MININSGFDTLKAIKCAQLVFWELHPLTVKLPRSGLIHSEFQRCTSSATP